ncbi:unnamed protein product [Microthlaspi erraticum]|uniref:Uncharacterized protein n=1 Tax=Microthlaspi erraticum TaxID=1685480 RepID=A0A6D2HM99_9BRAS|nr:unnamed protein product [Microthlaspi erraticum]
MIKVVKTGPSNFIENSRPNRAERPAKEHPSRGRPTSGRSSVPPEQWPSSCTDPGGNIPQSAKPKSHSRSHARPYRANREALPRGRAAQLMYRGRSRRPTRKASSHVRPNPSTKIIRPAEPDKRTRKLSATIDPTVPIADQDSTASRTSRPTVDDRILCGCERYEMRCGGMQQWYIMRW